MELVSLVLESVVRNFQLIIVNCIMVEWGLLPPGSMGEKLVTMVPNICTVYWAQLVERPLALESVVRNFQLVIVNCIMGGGGVITTE